MEAIDVGIVAYVPSLASLVNLLQTVKGYGTIWLFLNSPLTDDDEARLHVIIPSLQILSDSSNIGLGEAYNRIVSAVQSTGTRLLLLLDQDSIPAHDMIQMLYLSYRQICAFGQHPAVVGPRILASDGSRFKAPRLFRNHGVRSYGELWPAEFVISSGSLIDLDTFSAIGPFRSEFFIDAIDIEWCFRAQSLGYTCWVDEGTSMVHRLGLGVIRVPLVGLRLTKQPPVRLYTYVRNQVTMIGMRHIPKRWKLRIAPYLLVQAIIYTMVMHRQRRQVIHAFTGGVIDALLGRMGRGRRDSF